MIGPETWGPHGWKFIHYITLGYPENPTQDIKKKAKQFFHLIEYLLPCVLCRNNYKEHLKIYPLTDKILSDRQLLIDWGINMHNLVNIKNNKKKYSIEEGRKELENINLQCNNGIEHYAPYPNNVTQESVMLKKPKKSKYLNMLYLLPILLFGFILFKQIQRIKNK